jgi:hypothetical protein
MKKKLKSILAGTALASTLIVPGLLAGCSGNRELLDIPLPQSYLLPNPPNKVWEAVLLEASKPGRRILVRDEVFHLLSWVNEVQPEARLHASLTDPKIASGSNEEEIAIAVVRVEQVPGGSRLTTRLTYYSETLLGVSPSRGNYEQELLRAIRTFLISEAASHDKR